MMMMMTMISIQKWTYYDTQGANVDGYSPIYTPDIWSESGDEYKLGTKGLIAWYVDCVCITCTYHHHKMMVHLRAGLVVVLLGVGVTLVVSTSAIGQ